MPYDLYRASVHVRGCTLHLPLQSYCDLPPTDGVGCILVQPVSVPSVCGIWSDTAGADRFCTTVIQTVEVRGGKCRKHAIRSNSDRQYMSCFFFLWRCGPTRAMASSFLRFLDHAQRRTTVGRTPLDA